MMAREHKPAKDLPPPPKKPPPFIEFPGGTPRFCENCQHFKKPQMTRGRGECHNLISGNWWVRGTDAACRNGFYPDVVRFPIHVLMGIVPAKKT